MEKDIRNLIFAHVFKLSNTLQVYLDKGLKSDGLTSKQMFLMIVIGSFDEPPTFKEVADVAGSSYQNVKQLALKLEKQGFVTISPDEEDKRAKRLSLTQYAKTYWAKRDGADEEEMSLLFQDFKDDELKTFLSSILKLMDNIEKRSR